MILPVSLGGLPFWIIEFEIASRERIGSRLWRISTSYEPLFLNAARQVNTQNVANRMTAAQLDERLDANALNGEIAEIWVLDFERKRLATHPLVDQVRRISEDDVTAGYDIVSFSSSAVLHHDLFIEVKSYAGLKRFFWSRNEIAAAKILEEKYALYLVDREKFETSNYSPQIIHGPYSALFSSNSGGWNVSPTIFECISITTE